MIDLPVGFQIGGIFVATAGTIFGVYTAGLNKGAKKNGFVEKKDCQFNVDRMTKSIDAIHVKTNETNEGVAYIKGKMDSQ